MGNGRNQWLIDSGPKARQSETSATAQHSIPDENSHSARLYTGAPEEGGGAKLCKTAAFMAPV
jgi:hypothetical protein